MPFGPRQTEFSPLNDQESAEFKKFRLLGQLAGTAKRHEILGQHDSMTGLLNKTTWKERVRAAINKNDKFGILFIDLNNFKELNDVQGHEEGDKQLIRVGELLEQAARTEQDPKRRTGHDSIGHERLFSQNSVAGRYGGDEFVVLLEGVGSDKNFATVKSRIEDLFVDNGISAAIGGVLHQPNMPEHELYQLADQDMYQNKLQH